MSSDNNSANNSSPHLDTTFANLLMAASAEAYTDFANTNNPTYQVPDLTVDNITFKFVQRFTGFDDVAWGSGKEERYALLYQAANQANTYIVAFRGTSSVWDAIIDLESATTTPFKPYKNSATFPGNVHVGEGFNDVYATKSNQMNASLQTQIFTALQDLPDTPTEIFITGHSLGGALASLFTLDLAVSYPDIGITSITFASPKVGAHVWQSTYNQAYKLLTKTIRVCNNYDWVPRLPPIDFYAIGQEFTASFTVAKPHFEIQDVVLARHALTNYTWVISRAVNATPQVWTGTFVDQEKLSWDMVSINPDTHNELDIDQELAHFFPRNKNDKAASA